MTLLSPLPPDDKPLAWRKWFTQLKSSVDTLLNREEVSIEGLATEAELEAQAAASLAALQQSVSTLEEFFLEDDGAGGVRIKQDLLEITQGQIDGGSLVVGTEKLDNTRLFKDDFYDTSYSYFDVTAFLPTYTGDVELRRQYDNNVTPSVVGYAIMDAASGKRQLSTGALPMSFMSNADARFRVLNNPANSFLSCDWIIRRW